jgi:hypothetical protein
MSREFSVRVAPELASWVCRQGPPSRVIGRVATAAHRRMLYVNVPDPGPGPDRLTVRVPERALPVIRELTHSRDSLVALRKLILAGYQARALPSAPGVSVESLPKASGAILARREQYNSGTGLWHGTGTLCEASGRILTVDRELSSLSAVEDAPGGLIRFLDAHPVCERFALATLPVAAFGLVLWLLSWVGKPGSAIVEPTAKAASEVIRDGVWVPSTASTLGRAVW